MPQEPEQAQQPGRLQPEQLQEQQLLLSCRKQPGQQPTGTRSTVFFSWIFLQSLLSKFAMNNYR
jgi:hypothetical protein